MKYIAARFLMVSAVAVSISIHAATPIGTAQEFIDNVVADPTGDYILTADLEFNKLAGIPAFSGTLDGDGHKITGISSNLVNVLTGTIKDLTIYNHTFEHKRIKSNIVAPMGAFVLSLQGGTVSGCTLLNSQFTMPSGLAANINDVGFGGIIADVGAGGGVISDCKVVGCLIGCRNATDSQLQPFGGIVGRVSTADAVTISRCQVLNNETRGTAIAGCRVGGILGGMASTANVVIDGCYNEGTITNASLTAGGIVGNAADSNTSKINVLICNCTNVADIAVGCGGVGGIFGYVYKTGLICISGCVNRGSITSARNTSAFSATVGTGTGGIVGGIYSYTGSGGLRIDRCANFGAVSASTNCAGGIIGVYKNGNASTKCIISNSVNHASVTGFHYVGGMVGALDENNSNCISGDMIINCCQTGNVTANGDKAAGGLIGYLFGTASVKDYIKGVSQLGTVTAANFSASPMIGATGHGAKALGLYVDCVQISGTASCANGSTGIITGGAAVTSTGKFTPTVDDASYFANNTGTAYYDQTGAAQELTLNKLEDNAMFNKKAVKRLNEYASANGLVSWVQTKKGPDLSIFGNEVKSGLVLYIQ